MKGVLIDTGHLLQVTQQGLTSQEEDVRMSAECLLSVLACNLRQKTTLVPEQAVVHYHRVEKHTEYGVEFDTGA